MMTRQSIEDLLFAARLDGLILNNLFIGSDNRTWRCNFRRIETPGGLPWGEADNERDAVEAGLNAAHALLAEKAAEEDIFG